MYLSDLMETYNDTWFEMEHEEKESLILYQVIPLTLNNTQESAAETIINIESDEEMGISICEPADPETGCAQDVIEIESEGIECKTEIAKIGSEEMAEIGNGKIESSEEILKIRNEEIGNDKMQSNEEIREQDAKRNEGKKIIKKPADNKNYYTKKINDEERMKLLDEKKSLSNYKNRVFKCEMCVQGFTADGYEKHIKKFHSKSADYECHYCGRRMKSKRSLTLHIRRHYRNVSCPVCKKVYHRTWAMNDHYKLVHLRKINYYCGSCSRTNRILSNQLRSHTGEKPCNCQICSSEFIQKYSLKVHKQSVHKIP
nr:zinc finger protein 558-like isoform X2 [Danaus plexippus plexippus]